MHAGVKVAIAFARDAGFGDEASWKVIMMVEEWLQNVVEHGAPAAHTRIALRLEQLPGLVRVTISDAGLAFDPRPVEFHGPNADRGGGAGLAMIKAWSQLGYSRRAGRNRLVMEVPLP